MRMFEHETMYYCRACGHASPKAEFTRVRLIVDRDMRICPHCGTLFDVSIGNTVTEVDEGDIIMEMLYEPKPPAPPKPAPKKPVKKTAKKTAKPDAKK